MKGEAMEVRDASAGYVPQVGMPVVPEGYKQTEVGVIPEDWKTPVLFDIADCLDNLRVPLNEAQRRRMQGSIPYCGANGVLDFVNDFIVDDDIILMAEDGGYFDEYACRPIAYRMRGKCWVNNHAHILKAKEGFDQEFLFYSLVHKNILPFLASGTRAKLNKSEMAKIVIHAPPQMKEQRAIATALNDVDALLEALDRLIAKKRDIKQATMQQLLTGQTRLPGFGGDWDTKRLGDVFAMSAGSSKSTHISAEGNYWICDMGSVSTEGKLIVSKRTNYRGDFLLAGDLIMPKDDIGGGKIIGKVGYIDKDDTYILGDHVYCLRAREGDSQFLAYRINSYETNSALRKKVIGSAQLGLGRKSVEEQEILLPSPTEQTAIATVLAEMDVELEVLLKRRTKTAAIKQAMMQELLTGRTRLIETSREEALHG